MTPSETGGALSPSAPALAPGVVGLTTAVIIATVGRAAITRMAIDRLARQTRPPSQVIVVGASETDLAGLDEAAMKAEILLAPRGLCSQRNRGLDAVAVNTDLVVFFDDDFLPCDDFIANVEALFARHADVAGACGRVLADGANGPGLGFDEAAALVEAAPPAAGRHDNLVACLGLYGCNMAYRAAAIAGLRFDVNLPLYGWQEDFDFSYQVGRRGRLVRSQDLRGVHMGAKAGRSSGKRLGYSQIANPLYLLKKRTMPSKRALRLMRDNVAANLGRSLFPEQHVDRRGRLLGNLLAMRDLAMRKLDPRRILELD